MHSDDERFEAITSEDPDELFDDIDEAHTRLTDRVNAGTLPKGAQAWADSAYETAERHGPSDAQIEALQNIRLGFLKWVGPARD